MGVRTPPLGRSACAGPSGPEGTEVSLAVDRPPRRRRRFGRWAIAIEATAILLLPVLLGATVGLFEINPVEAEMLAPVGSEAHLLLNSFPDPTLVLEIAYQSTVGPPAASTVATLLDRVNETCQKSRVVVDEHAFTSSAPTFDLAGLLNLEREVRQHWPTWGTMSLFYLYLGAGYGPNPDILGLAYRGSSIAVFEGTIQAVTPGVVGPGPVTTTVMVHEFGHELALVGIYGGAPNEDPNHPDHSIDPNDVMYWEVDTRALVGGITSNPPTQFDAADMADLSTVRATLIPYEVLPWIVLGVSVLSAVLLLWIERRRDRAVAKGPAP